MRALILQGLAAAWRFLWDLLVGDTPELTLGTLAVLGIAWGLAGSRVGFLLVPAAVIVLLGASVLRGAGSR